MIDHRAVLQQYISLIIKGHAQSREQMGMEMIIKVTLTKVDNNVFFAITIAMVIIFSCNTNTTTRPCYHYITSQSNAIIMDLATSTKDLDSRKNSNNDDGNHNYKLLTNYSLPRRATICNIIQPYDNRNLIGRRPSDPSQSASTIYKYLHTEK